jgi:hypothetical protein
MKMGFLGGPRGAAGAEAGRRPKMRAAVTEEIRNPKSGRSLKFEVRSPKSESAEEAVGEDELLRAVPRLVNCRS